MAPVDPDAGAADTLTPAWQLSAVELGRAFASGSLTPDEAMQSILQRAAAVNGALNALIAVDAEQALSDAAASTVRWRTGAPFSALDGVPFTVKDNIPVAGFPCTWGSRIYAAYLPDRDELAVARLRAAGLIVIGKTNVPEFTLQGYTDNLLFGPTYNPWDLALTPGGSSGGAVACVAAGIAPVAIGTDDGGSIRRPCSHTGLVGLKPTAGCVARVDSLPEILPGMEVVGPIARTVADVAMLMRIVAHPDPRDWASPPPQTGKSSATFEHISMQGSSARTTPVRADLVRAPESLRIAYWPELQGDPVDRDIASRVDEVAERLNGLGHRVTRQQAPRVIGEFNRQAWPIVSQSGLAATLGHDVDIDALTPALQEILRAGRQLSAVDLFRAQQFVHALVATLNQVFECFDCVLLPSAAALPWPAGDSHPDRIDGQAVGPRGHAVFTAFVNAAGLPAINLPAEPADNGMPVGFQLVGQRDTDVLLCRVAQEYEQRFPWAMRWPAL